MSLSVRQAPAETPIVGDERPQAITQAFVQPNVKGKPKEVLQPQQPKLTMPREGIVLLPWLTWFSQVRDILSALTLSGPSESRPTALLWIGRPYYDTTLGYEINLDSVGAPPAPNVWHDHSGASV